MMKTVLMSIFCLSAACATTPASRVESDSQRQFTQGGDDGPVSEPDLLVVDTTNLDGSEDGVSADYGDDPRYLHQPLAVKFIGGLAVQADDNSFRAQPRSERSPVTDQAAIDAELNALNALLAGHEGVRHIELLFSSSEQPYSPDEIPEETELRQWFHVFLAADFSVVDRYTFADRLRNSRIVQEAYLTPIGENAGMGQPQM